MLKQLHELYSICTVQPVGQSQVALVNWKYNELFTRSHAFIPSTIEIWNTQLCATRPSIEKLKSEFHEKTVIHDVLLFQGVGFFFFRQE